MFPPIETLVSQQHNKYNSKQFVGTVLGLDPGKTTGYALMGRQEDGVFVLLEAGQLDTSDIEKAVLNLETFFSRICPTHVVMEDYKVYAHKTDAHTFNDLHTSQVIGIIKSMCIMRDISFNMQMASLAKGFCTDDKLRHWNLWQKGKKHARDAIRHVLYWAIFTQPKGD